MSNIPILTYIYDRYKKKHQAAKKATVELRIFYHYKQSTSVLALHYFLNNGDGHVVVCSFALSFRFLLL